MTPSRRSPTPSALHFDTEEEKDKAREQAFADVAARFGGTQEGAIAEIYLAGWAVDKGDLAGAEKRFKRVVDDAPAAYAALARLALAQVYASESKTADAEKVLRELIANPAPTVSKEQATIVLGQVLAIPPIRRKPISCSIRCVRLPGFRSAAPPSPRPGPFPVPLSRDRSAVSLRPASPAERPAALAHLRFPLEQSRGRRYPELPHPYRNPFQRDRDRVVHARAFRRLENKTQVFTAGVSDHFRNRLTHTIEVSQIARTIAGVLGLDEDLTEALALAHDIGHPPFGTPAKRNWIA